MNYQETIDYINHVSRAGSRFGLESIGRLLARLGHPERGQAIVHVAGTNGKGSTSAFLASILEAGGYRVGIFTSPYIECFNERISINGTMISDADVARLGSIIRQASEEIEAQGDLPPTTFEMVTAMGFAYFKEQEVDWIVLEVGLGGSLDCTNIIETPDLAIITTLGMDHEEILGHSLYDIAGQKAGIIKPGGTVLTYPQEPEALEAISERVEKTGAHWEKADFNQISASYADKAGFSYKIFLGGEEPLEIKGYLLGRYQVYNSALAVLAANNLRGRGLIELTNQDIARGVAKTRWMGRLEKLNDTPLVLVDGSHNLQGTENLIANLDLFQYDRLILVLGILKDKDYVHMVEALSRVTDTLIATEVPIPRTLAPDQILELWPKDKESYGIARPGAAFQKALDLAGKEDLILCAGSLYLVGSLRQEVLHHFNP